MALIHVGQAQNFGTLVGLLTPIATTIGGLSKVSALTLGAATPIVFGAMIGLMIMDKSVNYLKIRDNMYRNADRYRWSDRKENLCYFTLQAASVTLGSLIGLALTSALFTIAANPFTLPALIAEGISAAAILTLYAANRPVSASAASPRRPTAHHMWGDSDRHRGYMEREALIEEHQNYPSCY
ncbi:MAG: hypothetical protein CK424_02385 [Legionella sp.]|nr:MAG: hypothetical protein CK424_02385 [Legionella sp.]